MGHLLDRLLTPFKQKPSTPPTKDQAWSESSLYSSYQGEKYNPDDLIGFKGNGIYVKMMRDEQVKAAVQFRISAITSRDFYFYVDESAGLSESETERRIGLFNEIVCQMRGSFKDTLKGMLTSIPYGFSMTEKIYTDIKYEKKTYWGVQRLPLRPFDTFTFKTDEYGNIKEVKQRLNSKTQKIDIARFMHHVQNPDLDEHYGQSELRECYRAWISKDSIIMFRNMWLEQHAGGLRWAQIKEGETITPGTQAYINLQNALSTMRGGSSAIMPSEVDLNLSYPANQVAFSDAIRDYDLSIARALLVPNLMGITPSGQTGSYSQSDTQLEAFLWTLDADTSRLEETLNEQLFRQLGEYNFADGIFPRIRFKPISDTKMMELLNTWADLVQKGAATKTPSDEKHIRELLEFPEAEEVEEPPQPVLPNPENPENIENPDETPEDVEDMATKDATIWGFPVALEYAKDRAARRVDFAVIDRTSEELSDDLAFRAAKIAGEITDDLVERNEAKYKEGFTPKDINAIKAKPNLKQKMQRACVSELRKSWRLGEKHAESEIEKAQKESFTANKKRLNMASKESIDLIAFTMTGNITGRIEELIRSIITTGVQMDKTWSEVTKDIYTTLAAEGYIDEASVLRAMGIVPANVTNPAATILTIARTNGFKAINEARLAFFTEPELSDFVEALEYTAILDSRTTQICQHMDGKKFEKGSALWKEYNPPNHYNCRSLLIPLTQVDVWSTSPVPTIEPQKGFS